jgi:hypothetical protein
MSSSSAFSSPGASTARGLNDDTTPTPPGGQPLPLPAELDASPSRQAFLEAVASLSYASDVLSTAAKAMSSAAKSLALVDAYSDCGNFFMHTDLNPSNENSNQKWLTRDYTLSPAKETKHEQPTGSTPVDNGAFQTTQVVSSQS